MSVLSFIKHVCFAALFVGSSFEHASAISSQTVRLKDLVEIRGVRANQLQGIGLVVGLPGTGDSKASLATNKSVTNLINRLGISVKQNEVTTGNVAVVVVTAELPPFARVGDKIDIRISSVGDAASLEGGTLLLTPLSAADDQIYVVAQGSISQGNGMAGNQGGGSARSTAPKTVALSNGATVEREFAQSYIHNGVIELSLRNADFTTASRVARTINETFNEFIADAVNSGLVKVKLPVIAMQNRSYSPVSFVSALEQLKVEPDTRALVVINERTGTVISGGDVVVSEVAISHGNLEINVKNTKKMVGEIPTTTTVSALVRALNDLGAGPRDLIAILQALEAAKALKAELKLM